MTEDPLVEAMWRRYGDVPVMQVRPKGIWVCGRMQNSKLHRARRVVAAWYATPNRVADREVPRTRYGAECVCRSNLTHVTLHIEPPEVDLCDDCVYQDEHAVYRFFNERGALIYVGRTSRVAQRLRKHADSPWWRWVASASLEIFPTATEASIAESKAIATEDPITNRLIVGSRIRRESALDLYLKRIHSELPAAPAAAGAVAMPPVGDLGPVKPLAGP